MDKQNILRFFANIWPTVRKIIYSFFYFLLQLIKTVVRIAAEQIKGVANG